MFRLKDIVDGLQDTRITIIIVLYRRDIYGVPETILKILEIGRAVHSTSEVVDGRFFVLRGRTSKESAVSLGPKIEYDRVLRR